MFESELVLCLMFIYTGSIVHYSWLIDPFFKVSISFRQLSLFGNGRPCQYFIMVTMDEKRNDMFSSDYGQNLRCFPRQSAGQIVNGHHRYIFRMAESGFFLSRFAD